MRFLREFGTDPEPPKRSRLQPERIGARGPNDPYTLSGFPLPLYHQPTCTEIYGNSLFASFKSFRIILLPLFLLPPASKPTLPPAYKFFSFSSSLLSSCLHPTVSFSSSIRTSIFVQVRADTGVTQTRMQWNT